MIVRDRTNCATQREHTFLKQAHLTHANTHILYKKDAYNEEDEHVTSCRHQKQANDVELATDVLSSTDIP